jgi:hypothetical protein
VNLDPIILPTVVAAVLVAACYWYIQHPGVGNPLLTLLALVGMFVGVVWFAIVVIMIGSAVSPPLTVGVVILVIIAGRIATRRMSRRGR